MKTTTIDAAALAAILRRALTNEGLDGCCLPVVLECHCWRCDARRALGGRATMPLFKDHHGFNRMPPGEQLPLETPLCEDCVATITSGGNEPLEPGLRPARPGEDCGSDDCVNQELVLDEVPRDPALLEAEAADADSFYCDGCGGQHEGLSKACDR